MLWLEDPDIDRLKRFRACVARLEGWWLGLRTHRDEELRKIAKNGAKECQRLTKAINFCLAIVDGKPGRINAKPPPELAVDVRMVASICTPHPNDPPGQFDAMCAAWDAR